jgi:hypothetical protein
MHVTGLSLIVSLILGQPALAPGATVKTSAEDLETYTQSFYEKEASLLGESLQHLIQFDQLSIPDGVFGRYIDLLCALPPRQEHLPHIIKLLRKTNPYLQEAGVRLATASVAKLGEFATLERPLCDLLQNPDLDPWVFLAIVDFAKVPVRWTTAPDLTRFFGLLASVAYEPIKPWRPDRRNRHLWIERARLIRPQQDAQELLDWVMQNLPATPRLKAILPVLEKAYGTKGLENTRKAIEAKAARRNSAK